MDEKYLRDQLHHAAETRLSGLAPDPWLAQRVLENVKGEEKVKKKLSVGLVLILVLVLTTVTALATYFLSAQQIVQEEVLPIAIKNDQVSHQERFSNEELATIIKLAQENDLELSETMIYALEGGYGYSEQSTIMELASSEFGSYMEWTIEQQYWFGEVMVAIGWEETNNCRLPQNDEITFNQALKIAVDYVATTYSVDISDKNEWKSHVEYRLYAESAPTPRWIFSFEPTTPMAGRFDLILESDGTLVSCESDYGNSASGLDIIDQYRNAYGVYNLWTPKIWVEFSKSLASVVPDTLPTWVFQNTVYILPPEDGIAQDAAEEIALTTIGTDNAIVNSVVCCMDGDTPIWKIVTRAMGPEDIDGGKYSEMWQVEIDALTGAVRGQREYVVGVDQDYLTQWVPWAVYENLPERPKN